MKTVAVIFADKCSAYTFDSCFDGRSSFFRSLAWAEKSCDDVVVFSYPDNSNEVHAEIGKLSKDIFVIEKDSWSVFSLFAELAKICAQKSAVAVFAFADCPFLSVALTKELLDTHGKYFAEYTFADGYPHGFAPEIIDGGTAAILATICSTSQKKFAEQNVSRGCVWETLKTDINSFEIETLLAEEDFRLFRLSFDVASKRNLYACQQLYESFPDRKIDETHPLELSRVAIKNEKILKTLPAFYNVAITNAVATKATYLPDFSFGTNTNNEKQFMSQENFSKLVAQISDFSEDAVVSLSCWGEPLLHPCFVDFVKTVLAYEKLSVLVETDGNTVTEELCAKLKDACGKSCGRLIWIVTLDAATEETYRKLRVCENCAVASLANASRSVEVLSKYFDGQVYAQMTRLDTNEDELEAFYRFWSTAESPSKGKVIIQKYDSFCGLLPNRKPADLSPLTRTLCWHLRRDMTVLCDGTVPRCREFFFSNIVGNVFDEGVESIWHKMSLTEIEECGKCDEYYTYNF